MMGQVTILTAPMEIGNITWRGEAARQAPAAPKPTAPAPKAVTLSDVQARTEHLVDGFTRELRNATTQSEREAAQDGLANARRLQLEAGALDPGAVAAEVDRLLAAYPPETPDEDEKPRDLTVESEVDRLTRLYPPGGAD